MIAIVHSKYSQSVHAPARDAGLMDNDAERYCIFDERNAPNRGTTPNYDIYYKVHYKVYYKVLHLF